MKIDDMYGEIYIYVSTCLSQNLQNVANTGRGEGSKYPEMFRRIIEKLIYLLNKFSHFYQ